MIRFLFLSIVFASPALAQDATAPRPAYPGDEICPVKLPDVAPGGAWTEQEDWAWEQICLGRSAYMSDLDAVAGLSCQPADIENAGDTVPENRIIRSEFLQLITTRQPWADAPVKPQVFIDCAKIDGNIDLEDQQISASVFIDQSLVTGGANLVGARFDRSLGFQGTVFRASISADYLRVGGSLFLRHGSKFKGVRLTGATVSGDLEADGSEFDGVFQADGIRVAGDLSMQGGATFGAVSMIGASIGGDLVGVGSTFNGLFGADRIQVAGSVFFRHEAAFQDVRLLGGSIGGDLDAVGSEFAGFFGADRLQVGGDVYFREGASFQAIDMPSVAIEGHLQLSGSAFYGMFDLSGAKIAELVMYSPDTVTTDGTPISDDPIWGADAKLILRNTSVTALQSRPESWQHDGSWIKAELTGLSYERLGGFRAGEAATLIEAEPDILVEWLEETRPTEMADRYDPGPYEKLAAILATEGLAAHADAVLYAKFNRRSAVPPKDTPWWEKTIAWPLSRWLVGYGIYPSRSGYAFAILIFIGVFLARFSSGLRQKKLGYLIWYSVDDTLPIVSLKDAHRQIEHDCLSVESMYNLLKLLGLVIASYLVGALTLLGS